MRGRSLTRFFILTNSRAFKRRRFDGPKPPEPYTRRPVSGGQDAEQISAIKSMAGVEVVVDAGYAHDEGTGEQEAMTELDEGGGVGSGVQLSPRSASVSGGGERTAARWSLAHSQEAAVQTSARHWRKSMVEQRAKAGNLALRSS
jgi:hypothetical protein